MTDPNPQHWRSLAEQLGAEIPLPPEEPPKEPLAEASPPPAPVEQKRERSQSPKPKPGHWYGVAGELGLEVSKPPPQEESSEEKSDEAVQDLTAEPSDQERPAEDDSFPDDSWHLGELDDESAAVKEVLEEITDVDVGDEEPEAVEPLEDEDELEPDPQSFDTGESSFGQGLLAEEEEPSGDASQGGETPAEENEKSGNGEPRRRRRRRRRPRSDGEGASEGDGKEPGERAIKASDEERKQRKFPTWNDSIGLIVSANIERKEKAPKGRGRPRRRKRS